jgi:hypothetical protein
MNRGEPTWPSRVLATCARTDPPSERAPRVQARGEPGPRRKTLCLGRKDFARALRPSDDQLAPLAVHLLGEADPPPRNPDHVVDAGRNQPVAFGVPHALDADAGTLTPLDAPTAR